MTRACALCGKRLAPDKAIYSRFTHNHYCADADACDRRRARAKVAR